MAWSPRRLPLQSFLSDAYVCRTCQRTRFFSVTARPQSGHSKWATIRHDKAKNDAARNKQRSVFAQEISNAVKLGGPNPDNNPRLALAISTAKKGGTPKALIEASILRGQGISATGKPLESLVIEGVLPNAIATVIDVQTDNKLRTLADIRLLIKDHGGTAGETGYLFQKKGRVVLAPKQSEGEQEPVSLDEETVLEAALEAGAEDVLEGGEQGVVVVSTEVTATKEIARSMSEKLGLEVKESGIVYEPLEDMKVPVPDAEAAASLGQFLDKLREYQGVQGVYMNFAKGDLEDSVWEELEDKVDS